MKFEREIIDAFQIHLNILTERFHKHPLAPYPCSRGEGVCFRHRTGPLASHHGGGVIVRAEQGVPYSSNVYYVLGKITDPRFRILMLKYLFL